MKAATQQPPLCTQTAVSIGRLSLGLLESNGFVLFPESAFSFVGACFVCLGLSASRVQNVAPNLDVALCFAMLPA